MRSQSTAKGQSRRTVKRGKLADAPSTTKELPDAGEKGADLAEHGDGVSSDRKATEETAEPCSSPGSHSQPEGLAEGASVSPT